MQLALYNTAMFRDRIEAGRRLGEELAASYANRPDVLVLGLPRGGIPVAFETADVLRAPLDVFVVRKLGVPGYEELAMGAVASGDVMVLNPEVVEGLGIVSAQVEAVAARERREIERRERLYRGGVPPEPIEGKTAILVDDGLATGATMRAAVSALRRRLPVRIVAAVPVGSAEACAGMALHADAVVCVSMPEPFRGVGMWYADFVQADDAEVARLLDQSRRRSRHAPRPDGKVSRSFPGGP